MENQKITVSQINDFVGEDGNPDSSKIHVQFSVQLENGSILICSKPVVKDASKTMDDYINESYQLSKPEIDEWVETQSYLGKEINL